MLKEIFIPFFLLIFIGFLCGKSPLESTLIILGVYALGFLLVGIVFSIIYLSNK